MEFLWIGALILVFLPIFAIERLLRSIQKQNREMIDILKDMRDRPLD